jgi:DNA-binding beta-propeller fold protein YncE
MWWPMEDYKNLTWERIQNAITDPAMRSAVWDILWNRDYTNYAKLTNETLNPPTDWSPAEKMRVYVRNDIALKMLSLSLGSTMLADIPKPVDAYISVKRMVDSKIVIQNSGLNNPRNLVIAKDGSVYAADTGNSRILKYNAAGELITSWGTRSVAGQTPPAPATFAEPWGITLDGDGNVLVADTWNHRIQKFDPNGKFLLQWGISGVAADGLDRLWGPRGIAVAPDGAIYVTDSGNKRVVAFSPEGKPLFEFLQEADARLDEPVGIAIGPDNKVYVADTWNFRVAVFALDGKFERSFPVQGWNSNSIDNKPYLAVDSADRVYVTDPEGYRVLVFSPDGKPLLTFGEFGSEESSFGLPTGITLSPDGKLWVADAGNARLTQFQNLWP